MLVTMGSDSPISVCALMSLRTLYLAAYNVAAAVAWAVVGYLIFTSLREGKSAQETWSKHVLEILHALFRITRSPVMPTVIQVYSRLFIILVSTGLSAASQAHWSLFLTVGSWALVEVPRYLFYAVNLFTDNVPYPLFWLRYSLFAVLYPSGITGELLQMICSLPALKTAHIWAWYVTVISLALYIPGGPFMYFHMIHQRKGAFAKRNPPPARPLDGLQFPVTNQETGERSTTVVNKGAFAAAAEGLFPEHIAAINKEKNWRFRYNRYVVDHVRQALKSPATALRMAEQGLAYLHNTFEFIRDGKAMATFKGSFQTGILKGKKPKPTSFDYTVPYKGKDLSGKELLTLLDKWVAKGTIEPEARDGIAYCVENKKVLDLSDKYFVLLGAGSAMGPLQILLAHGANVIAVDLNREPIWKRLASLVENSCGTMYFPIPKEQSSYPNEDAIWKEAGCNLFTQTPEIANWVNSVEPSRPVTIGGYAYLDGALHVQVSLAMDAIMQSAIRARKNVSLAFLCTPTDCHVIPHAARDAAIANNKNAPFYQKLLQSAGYLRNNALSLVDGVDSQNNKTTFAIVDGLTVEQGPNYALAKRMQHWRAVVARSRDAVPVASNVAPSTATASVLSNKQFAAAFKGMEQFAALEVFFQETSNAVMAALLIHDITNSSSPANPSFTLRNPYELFAFGGLHGGIWRCPFHFNSTGPVSFLYGMAKLNIPALTAVVAVVAMFVGAIFTYGAPHTWAFLPF